MAAVTSIMRAEQIFMGRLNALLDPLGLTFPRYEALMLLYFSRSGALPLGKMGDRLQIHRTAITHIVDRLVRDGFAVRAPHESDRRTTLAKLTPKGRRTAERATKLLNDERFGTAPLRRGELEELFTLLRALRLDEGDFTAD